MMKFAAGMIQSQIATMTDEEILDFIGQYVLSKMTRVQQEKLRDYINQRVPANAGA